MELWRYYRIIRKRKWLIIIGTLICVGIVWLSTVIGPEKYEARTTIMEKFADEGVTIYTPALAYQFDPKLRLANLAQLVKSRTVIERSAETLARLQISTNPEEILPSLVVTPLLDTTLLVIKIQSESEDEAKATADVVAAEFIKFYNQLNYGGAARTKKFIQTELPKVEARLGEIRDEMRRFKEENDAVMLDQQTAILLNALAQFQTLLAQYQVQAEQGKAKVRSVEQQLRDYPEVRTAAKVVASNPIWQSLQVELAKQEIEMQRMLRKRTGEHPEVKALEQQIAETRRKLEEVGTTILNSTTEATNPVHEGLVETYVQGLVEASASDAACAAAQETIDSLQPDLQSLPAKEMTLAQLTLDERTATNTYALLRQKLDEATIKESEAENISSIEVVDTAKARAAETRRTMKLILAVILSPVFCTGVAFLLNYLDNSVRTPDQAEELLKLPVFAVVPIARSHLLTKGKHLRAIDTSYQMLSTNLWSGSAKMESRTVLVASAEPDVGRSVTAANLAVTLAQDGARVILVDSDLRQPMQHIIFDVENDKGLSNVLAGQLPLKDALKATSVTDLLLIPSGPLPANPVRLFRSPEMSKFVDTVNDLADFVIFDSPAGITFADSTLLAALVRNVIIVYEAGVVPRGAEAEFRKRLDQVDANLLGVVLNMVNPEDSHGFYHFRSAYEELLKDGRTPSTLSDRVLGAIPEKTDQEADTSSSTES